MSSLTFKEQIHPLTGEPDTEHLCAMIERVHKAHETCEDPSYRRRALYLAIQKVRTTNGGWLLDTLHVKPNRKR